MKLLMFDAIMLASCGLSFRFARGCQTTSVRSIESRLRPLRPTTVRGAVKTGSDRERGRSIPPAKARRAILHQNPVVEFWL
jgi:hypothetical protein